MERDVYTRPSYWDKRYDKGTENLSQPVYAVVKEDDVFMTTRDGVRLAVDIYRPNAAVGEAFPGLVAYSSYGKSVQTLTRAPLQFKTVLMDHTIEAGDVEYYASCGYVVAVPDARGVGKSGGQWDGLYGRQEAEDCFDVIEWLAARPGCTGKIGMIGISYFSILQPFVAALKPPHLTAIMMCEVLDSLYLHNYVGGAFFDRSFLYNHFCPAHSQMSWSERHYTKELLREKVRQRLADPETAQSALLTRVLSCWPPRHQSYFFDVILHNYDDDFWAERNLTNYVDQLDIPMYLMSEYYDRGRFTQGPFYVYNHVKPGVPKKLFAPESHDDLHLPHRSLTLEYLRWYDYWLKGIDTGVMDEPSIKLKVEGSGRYRYEQEWPLARTRWEKVYLQAGGGLSTSLPEECSPSELVQQPQLQNPVYPREVPCLRFSTPPLPDDREVTGPLTLFLEAALNVDDANIQVLLNDVDEGGKGFYVTSGSLRAAHACIGFENDKPWAPLYDHSRKSPVESGRIQRFVIEIMSISRVFKQGHRLEIALQNTCQTEFNFITFLPPTKTVRYEIHHSKEHPSYLLLPVIPSSPKESWVEN